MLTLANASARAEIVVFRRIGNPPEFSMPKV
jgi:hypothetical protein